MVSESDEDIQNHNDTFENAEDVSLRKHAVLEQEKRSRSAYENKSDDHSFELKNELDNEKMVMNALESALIALQTQSNYTHNSYEQTFSNKLDSDYRKTSLNLGKELSSRSRSWSSSERTYKNDDNGDSAWNDSNITHTKVIGEGKITSQEHGSRTRKYSNHLARTDSCSVKRAKMPDLKIIVENEKRRRLESYFPKPKSNLKRSLEGKTDNQRARRKSFRSKSHSKAQEKATQRHKSYGRRNYRISEEMITERGRSFDRKKRISPDRTSKSKNTFRNEPKRNDRNTRNKRGSCDRKYRSRSRCREMREVRKSLSFCKNKIKPKSSETTRYESSSDSFRRRSRNQKCHRF